MAIVARADVATAATGDLILITTADDDIITIANIDDVAATDGDVGAGDFADDTHPGDIVESRAAVVTDDQVIADGGSYIIIAVAC